jgi:von Willebrand factor type A domain
MNRLRLVGPIVAFAALALAVGCSGSKQQDPMVARAQDRPLVVASDCPTQAAPAVEPPYVFTPVAHPAHVYPRYVAPPPLDALPKLVLGANRCTPGGKAMEAVRPSPSKKGIGTRPAWSAAAGKPTAVARAKAPAKKVVRPAAEPRQPSSPAPAGPARASEKSSMAARPSPRPVPAAAAPPAEVQAAPMQAAAPSSAPTGDTAQAYERGPEQPYERGPVIARPEPEPEPCPEPPPPVEPPDPYNDWGSATYLSNDDTMSLSSAQRIAYAIDHFLPVPLENIRPHELLNYFSFQTADVSPNDDFSVLPSIARQPGKEGVFSLGLSVQGRRVSTAARRNVVLTVLVDRSGSMKDEGRMDYLKRGLLRMTRELKAGDIVHLLTFNTSVCVPVESFVAGRDKMETLEKAIRTIRPQGNTDLYAGLLRAYQIADSTYQRTYSNRVLVITDALANTGRTDPALMGIVSKHYDARRIRLSGIGVGRDFNDRLLDQLTERGKGAYVFLGSEQEVDAVFGDRFVSLVETSALDTHFRLHLPPSLRLAAFYGEESSTNKAEVMPVHYFANTAQLFLADVMAKRGQLRPQDYIMLEIEYEHPDTGARSVEEHAFRIGDIPTDHPNSLKGRLIMNFAEGLGWMAERPVPLRTGPGVGRWEDDEAAWECYRRRDELRTMGQAIAGDPEVVRVLGLWDKFCTRFATPRSSPPGGRQGWPGAQP